MADWGSNGPIINGKQTASAAHIYGKRVAAAEAFTSFMQWMESPASLKLTADRAFCEGFNWLFIFSTATQTGDEMPGIEFHAGTHFNRKITWWNQAKSFTDYLARCSYLLQQGLFVADVCYYNGDGAPNLVEPKHVDPSLGAGYDYDVCNAEVLLTRMGVRDGRIVLPDGMSYRLLVLAGAKGHADRGFAEDSRAGGGRRHGGRTKTGKRHRLEGLSEVRRGGQATGR